MAKGKHAAALFEVIHSGKRPEHAAGALRTPKWWFKGRPVKPQSAPTEIEEPLGYSPEPDPEPQVTAPRPQVSRRRTRMQQSEGNRREVTMRMRFSTAVVGGFVLLVLVGVAYVIGRHVAGGPESANASAVNPSDDVRQQQPVRGALEVTRRTPRTTGTTGIANANSNARRGDPVRPRDVAPPVAQGNISEPETVVEATGPREFGLNYIVVMTYPPDRKDVAQQACDYMGKHGIACSVEEAPPNIFHRGWWAVITRKGFVKTTSDPAYNVCMERIEKLAPDFKSTPRSDRFSPTSFKLK